MRKSFAPMAVALLGAAVLAGPAAAQTPNVGVGQSGWKWGNPQPQGNTLRAVEFAGGVGYAAGDFGTLLRTTDSGLTWSGIPTGIVGDLSRIRAVDANTVLIGAGCVLRRSDDGGATFRRVPFTNSETNCPAGLASFHFPSPQRGYLVLADGTVQTTTDGGQTFSGVTALPGTPAGAGGGSATPTDIFFVSDTTGFATAGGTLFRTTDGGNTWAPRYGGGAQLASILMTSATTGYAVGAASTFLKTTDGGDTWVQQASIDTPVDLTQIRCAPGSSDNCLISTRAGDRVLRTADGGMTIASLSASSRPIYAVAYATANNASGVGESGATVASADAGPTSPTPSFTTVGSRLAGGDLTLTRVRATDATLVHATGDNGKLARSVDGGKSWTTVGVPTSEDLADVSFVDASNGYTVDTAGTLRYTADGGGRWTPLDTGTIPAIHAIDAVDKDIVLLFTSRGIFRSAAASDTSSPGTTFEAVQNPKVQKTAFLDYDRTAGPALFAWSTKAIWVSTNQGVTWKTVHAPVKKPFYDRVDFVSAKTGFALTDDGRLYATANGGKTWAERLATGTQLAADLAMADAKNGYMTTDRFDDDVSGGWVLRTSDGGVTWRPQLIGSSPIASDGLESPAAGSAFALGLAPGRSSDLFFTENGGDQGQPTAVTATPSATKLKKAGNVRFTVKVSPAVIGAPVALRVRTAKSNAWRSVAVPGGAFTKSAGTYTVTVKVKSTSYFVAQWRGDADRNGDGSPAVKVQVGKR